jgi:hypothetical protein
LPRRQRRSRDGVVARTLYASEHAAAGRHHLLGNELAPARASGRDVGSVQCILDDAGKTAVIGETDGAGKVGNPLQSLAHFKVDAGEAVNVGQLDLVPIGNPASASAISATDVDAATMERLRKAVPSLASSMVTRLMSPTTPGQTYKVAWLQTGGG